MQRQESKPTTIQLTKKGNIIQGPTVEDQSDDPELQAALLAFAQQICDDAAGFLDNMDKPKGCPKEPADNNQNPELASYLKSYSLLSNTKKAQDLQLEAKDFADHLLFRGKIVDKPVRLGDKVFEWNYLNKLPVVQNGYRQIPGTDEFFSIKDIQPALDIRNAYDQLFDTMNQPGSEEAEGFSKSILDVTQDDNGFQYLKGRIKTNGTITALNQNQYEIVPRQGNRVTLDDLQSLSHYEGDSFTLTFDKNDLTSIDFGCKPKPAKVTPHSVFKGKASELPKNNVECPTFGQNK